MNATVSAFSTLSTDTLSHRPKHHTQSHKSTKPALCLLLNCRPSSSLTRPTAVHFRANTLCDVTVRTSSVRTDSCGGGRDVSMSPAGVLNKKIFICLLRSLSRQILAKSELVSPHNKNYRVKYKGSTMELRF